MFIFSCLICLPFPPPQYLFQIFFNIFVLVRFLFRNIKHLRCDAAHGSRVELWHPGGEPVRRDPSEHWHSVEFICRMLGIRIEIIKSRCVMCCVFQYSQGNVKSIHLFSVITTKIINHVYIPSCTHSVHKGLTVVYFVIIRL